jgi:hypothetical protein
MILKQKQEYEANFNLIGYFLLDAFERCEDRIKRKKISNLIKSLNIMYMYTNRIEMESIKQKIQNEYIKKS